MGIMELKHLNFFNEVEVSNKYLLMCHAFDA